VRKEFLLRQFMEKEFADKNYKEAEQYASQVLAMIEQNGSSTEDVLLVLAKSKLAQNKTQDALEPLFQLTVFKNRSGAEAQYLQAEIYLSQKQIDKAEEKVDALLKRKPAYKYWNAKGFLLMSDILLAKSDTLQAKLTLESILQGYKAENAQDDVIASAKQRYQKIIEPKNIRKEKEESPVEEMELNFNPEEAEKLRKLYN
jgi:predicted Zn-dependent protease